MNERKLNMMKQDGMGRYPAYLCVLPGGNDNSNKNNSIYWTFIFSFNPHNK